MALAVQQNRDHKDLTLTPGRTANYRKQVSFMLTLSWLWIYSRSCPVELVLLLLQSWTSAWETTPQMPSSWPSCASSSTSASPPPLPPPLQTDVDLFGKLSVQVVDQSVEILQAESAVKRSIKIQEVVHVQASSSSTSRLGPRLSFLLHHLLFFPTAWNSNVKECLVCRLLVKVNTVWRVHRGLPGSLSLPATSS